MVPRKSAGLIAALFLVACGERDARQPVASSEPVPSETPTPEAPQPQPQPQTNAALPSFSQACDGNGPHADLGVTALESDGGVQLAMVHCAFYAYQGYYEVWVLPAADGGPFKTVSLTGMGGLSDDGVTFVNFNKARGPGDCGTFTRYSIDAQGLHETEVRSRECTDTPPDELDPSSWPLVGDGPHPCEGRKTFFYCPVRDGKEVALCGNADGSALQYIFGARGMVELTLPQTPDSSSFRGGTESWIRSEVSFVAVENEGYRYYLVDKSGSGAFGEGDQNNFIGVRVDRGTEEIARIACTGDDRTWDIGVSELVGQLQSIGYGG